MTAVAFVVEYLALPGAQFDDEDASIIGAEIARLGDDATAEAIVDSARPPDAPLHPYLFRWSEAEAAELWRRERARHLAQHIAVRVVGGDGEEITVRAFHAVRVPARRMMMKLLTVNATPT